MKNNMRFGAGGLRAARYVSLGCSAIAALTFAGVAQADPMSTPSMSGELSANPNPTNFDLGWLGKTYVTGAVTGIGMWQNNPNANDNDGRADLSNAQVFIQKTDGLIQYFIQAGEYSFPTVGVPYVRASTNTSGTFGGLPVAYLKIQPTDSFSIEGGKLPTLIGDEYSWTFENFNIERGLLWNLEPVVSQGVQLNYTQGPITVNFSVNDGYYSGRLGWLSGLVTWTIDSNNTLAVAAGGNTDHTAYAKSPTPFPLNNSSIYNVIYTYTNGPWTISPYIQFQDIPKDVNLGVPSETSTFGGAILGGYSFNDNWKLSGRFEYVTESGSTDLLGYGLGSNAYTITLTPSYQYKIFFARAELSYVSAGRTTVGSPLLFGKGLNNTDQVRALAEVGFLF